MPESISQPASYAMIVQRLSETLPAKRFLHTLGVVQTAGTLACVHNADIAKVSMAALLHDCAKGLSAGEIKTMIDAGRFSLREEDLEFPAIWHGAAGAVLAKDDFGVDDGIILDAVEHHTLGHRNPSLVLQILMAADATEPTRDYPGVDEYRCLVRKDLRRGLLTVLEAKMQHVEESGRVPHSRMRETISWLREQ